MKIMITKPDLFAAALKFVSTEKARHYMGGVCLQPRAGGGCYLVATDGRRLFAGVDLDATGVDKEYIIRPMARLALAGISKATGMHISDTLITPQGVKKPPVTFEVIDAAFPDWRWIIPTVYSGVTCQFNCEYLASFQAAEKLLGGLYVRVFHNGGSGGGVCLIRGHREDWFGVLMAVREKAATNEPGIPEIFNIPQRGPQAQTA